MSKQDQPLPEEQIRPCRICGQGFDVTTEDPQFPGCCRDCGDKRRPAEQAKALPTIRTVAISEDSDRPTPIGVRREIFVAPIWTDKEGKPLCNGPVRTVQGTVVRHGAYFSDTGHGRAVRYVIYQFSAPGSEPQWCDPFSI